jgi:catechol 2,3-dioxygenase
MVRDGDAAHLIAMRKKSIDSGVRMGHVHLKVADLERALGFYSGVLGFEVTQRLGDSAAFLSAGGYHHHIGLNTWESAGGAAPAAGTTGLYHLAIVYPTRAELGDALRRLVEAGVTLDGAADHGVSEALYLRDPDGNGVLGSSAGGLAAGCQGRVGDVYAGVGSEGVTGGCGLSADDQIVLPEGEDYVHLAVVGDVFAVGDLGP